MHILHHSMCHGVMVSCSRMFQVFWVTRAWLVAALTHHCTVEGALKPLLEAKGRPRHQNVKDLEHLDPARCQPPDTWCGHVERARHCMRHFMLCFMRLILILADLESYRDTSVKPRVGRSCFLCQMLSLSGGSYCCPSGCCQLPCWNALLRGEAPNGQGGRESQMGDFSAWLFNNRSWQSTTPKISKEKRQDVSVNWCVSWQVVGGTWRLRAWSSETTSW